MKKTGCEPFGNLLALVNYLSENNKKIYIRFGVTVYPEHLFTFVTAYKFDNNIQWWIDHDSNEIYPEGYYDTLSLEIID